MMKTYLPILGIALLFGCKAPEPAEPVVASEESMALYRGLRPEILLFPEYLLMEDYELFQHGRIPGTGLIGAGIQAPQSLSNVRKHYDDVLDSKGWNIEKTEIGRQSFRAIASLKGETLEIRAVQWVGPTKIFLLYKPKEHPIALDMTKER